MAIGTQQDSDEMMSEINMIPFIDVMLVLLIIFIITVPVIKHAVNIELPQASIEKVQDKPDNIRLSVDAAGQYFWNDQPVADAHPLVEHKTAPMPAARFRRNLLQPEMP